MAPDNRILLIPAGGTFVSEPYADPYSPPLVVTTLKGDASPLPAVVAALPGHERIDVFHWGLRDEDRFNKDSSKFTAEDVKALAEVIKNDDHRYFIVTHGTDYMTKNATEFKKALGDTDKVIAFAGAVVPLSMRDRVKSDGVETLQFAAEHIGEQPPGVTIIGRDAKTGRRAFFNPEQVEKDRAASKKDLTFSLSFK